MKLRKIGIEKEKQQLYDAFKVCFDEVQGDVYCELFADEKYRHSLQVLGTGNYILKNEKIFHGKNEEYLKTAKLVTLFHDIGRFKEISLLCKDSTSKHNHGFYSYERLKDLGYSDGRLLLPVKLHGGLVDALEKDEEYRQISDVSLKQEIAELYGLVKDADKIANFHIIKHECRVLHDIFFENISEEAKKAPLSPLVLSCIVENRLVKHSERYSLCDRLVQVLCQVFEIYYQASFVYLKKHDLFEPIYVLLREYNQDKELQEYIEKTINAYVAEHMIENQKLVI